MSDSRSPLLNDMHQSACALLDVLEREQQVYAERQPMSAEHAAEIEALSQQKIVEVKKLELMEKQRLSQTDSVMVDDRNDDPQWQAIRDTLAKCRRLNDAIGANIVAQANYTQRAVDILSGGSAENATVYSAEGRASSPMGSRALGRA